MQNVIAVSATAENLGIQRAARYRLASSSPPNVCATLVHGTRKLTTRIFAVALLSASAIYATATDVRAQAKEQFNSQNNNSIEREINAAAGRDVRVGICSSVRPDCSSGPLPSIRLAVAPAWHRHGQACDPQGDQFEAMFGSGGAGICRVLSRQLEFQRRGSLRTGN